MKQSITVPAGALAAVLALAPGLAAAADPPFKLMIGEGAVRPLASAAVIRIDGAGDDTQGEGRDDVTCLTQAVYYEARSESLAGQQAVAQVVINRTRDPQYPSSVCGAVFERTGAEATCQFSFACDGSMDRAVEAEAWDKAHAVAQRALAGFTYAPMRDATHFHAVWVRPYWSASLVRLRKIGGHVFYR